jgi:nucleoid-associated protein YgaU
VLESVTQTFDFFNALGMPLRARLNVTLKGHDTLEDLLGSHQLLSADRTKQWIFKKGDTLQRIAAQEYGDPNKWRPIAEANNIDNPLTIAVGRALKVPALT